MTGYVSGGAIFIYASYGLSAVVLGGLVIWTWVKLQGAKKKLAMLEASDSQKDA